jgi:NAD(P)H-hydrate epimerase
MPFPLAENLPAVSKDQMVEVDRLMVEHYGILLAQMMENAGRCLAVLARERFLGGNALGKTVLVMAGPGGNGGGAMVAARRLANWGANVSLVLSRDENRLKGVPKHQLDILRAMKIPVVGVGDFNLSSCDLIIDGLIGYSLEGPPRGKSAKLIAWANQSEVPVLSLDVPSGLDATSGEIHLPTIKAAATLTLALPKSASVRLASKSYIGDHFCADISVPPALYAEPGIDLQVPPVFAKSDIVRIP